MSEGMIIKGISGMNDILPDNDAPYYLRSKNWLYVTRIFQEMTEIYDYEYIETPEVELVELFKRTSGVSSDIVQKEMYSWNQGDQSVLSLRPEGSASACRAVIQSNLIGKRNSLKIWYRGGMFRHERPQFGRYRRHVQLGLEFYGEAGPLADSEVIYFLIRFYQKCGLTGFVLHLNSVGCPACRPVYRDQICNYVNASLAEYCDDCQNRFQTNPMRILDCKTDKCRELNKSIPPITSFLCDECAQHFEGLKKSLDSLDIQYIIDPTLVRGLDYYTRTTFEVILDEAVGPMKTLCGGGRYDGLFENIGGKKVPAVGFGAGIERLLLTMEKQGVVIEQNILDAYLVYTEEDLQAEAYQIAMRLRFLGIKTDLEFSFKKLKKQMSLAVSKGARYCIILGGDEMSQGLVKIKNLLTTEQIDVPLAELESYFLALLKK